MNGDSYVMNGYYSEAVLADGPWEAVFRFCGKHGCNPKDVDVTPKIRAKGWEYWCTVGKMQRGVCDVGSAFRLMDNLRQQVA